LINKPIDGHRLTRRCRARGKQLTIAAYSIK